MTKVADDIQLNGRELAAWTGFLATHSQVFATLEEELEREHGLSLGAYEVLLFLSGTPERSLRMGTLADRLLLSRSGLTRLVDRLVARGLVTRSSCPDDRRGTLACLTDEGLRRFEEAQPTHLRGVRRNFVDRIAAEDLELLATTWKRILEPGS